jgi:alpha-glucosidase (family GH31 glycosyl hydrolase)
MPGRWLIRAALVAAAVLATGFGCSGGRRTSSVSAPLPASTTWTHPSGAVAVDVATSPFSLVVRDGSGDVLLETTPAHSASDAGDPVTLAYAPIAFTHNEQTNGIENPMKGWDDYRGEDGPWQAVTNAKSVERQGDALVVHLATDDPAHPSVTLRIEPSGPGVHLVATVGDPGTDPDTQINRLSMGWTMHDDAPDGTSQASPEGGQNLGLPGDHFLGLGERFYLADHRGQPKTYVWVEDKGLGQGESTPPGPDNPIPNGDTMTYIPVPWFLSPRGFGLLLQTTFRTEFHLGDEVPDAWRLAAWTPALDALVFADSDPKNLLADLTALTGRPPAVADWVLAPRRRGDVGSGEWDKLRAAHVPTSVIDTAVHYFPTGDGSDHVAMRAATAELHAKGFKAVAYFCPFVADSWHPVFDDLVAKGYFVKHADGTPYTVLDVPYNAGMIDFTNPDAVAWFQQQMQQALDDGWDGWMYDFAEYVPEDAVFANGMTGWEGHNLYPLLYQKAVHDLMEAQRPGDYLVFARSGYAGPTPFGFAGTGGLLPMVWAGDESTDFDVADGLPAALMAALNAGMSGIPLWGSDIGGFHFIYNPPPDEEVYLRWTELGAFSADMHDENTGAGNGVRFQIWDDPNAVAIYAKYAGIKTQMVPYVKMAVDEARQRGTPVMRHLYLDHPRDPATYTLADEYTYGDSLLVAPVTVRGAIARPVYLPDPAYFDYWTGARVAGGGVVTAPAPLDTIPVFAKMGAIVPMLAPDVETVVTPTDGSVISAATYANFLEVDVFAGGATSVTLSDGTVLSQSAPAGSFTPGAPSHAAGAIPMTQSEAGLLACDACAYDDPASHIWSVSVQAQVDTIAAPPLTLSVSGAPAVKRLVFRVRH